jgi:hypothetical protein
MVVRGVKDSLLRAERFAAGHGPFTPIRDGMERAVHHATWVATSWTAIVWVAAAVTIYYASSHPRLEPRVGADAAQGDAQ